MRPDARALVAGLSALPADRPTPDGPVHVVYGGAHLFRSDLAKKLGERALSALHAHAPDPASFAESFGVRPVHAPTVRERVVARLRSLPVEDFRIDFEDGFGARSDAEGDAEARRCAEQLARGQVDLTLPPGIGVRLQPMSDRAIQTFDVFFGRLAEVGRVPAGARVTLPKVRHPAEVEAAARMCDAGERAFGGRFELELMLEHPRALVDARGALALPALIEAGEGRVASVHLGPYDLTASLGVFGSFQRPDHPVIGVARQLAALALAGSGVRLVDGASHRIPVGPHRGEGLTDAQRAENDRVVRGIWAELAAGVRTSLASGVHQGWDIHPAQIPARLAAVFAVYVEDLDVVAGRARGFLDARQRASRVGVAFDDAASARGVFDHLRRGLARGALTERDLAERGLSPADLA